MKKFNLITIFCLLATVAVSVESFAIRSKTAPRRQPADTNSLASVAQTTSQEEDTDGSESVKGYEKPIESGSASSPSEEDSGIEAVPTSEETHPAPEPYSFSYSADTEDGASSTREETGDKDGRITGFYMLSNSDGTQRRVNYVADKTGFHATIVTNEAGTESKNPADVTIDSSAPEVVYPEGPTASSGSSSSSSRGSTSRTVTTSNTSSFRSPSSSRTTTSNVKTDAVDDENETEFGSSASTGSASSAKRPDTQIADNNDDENEENSTGFSNADEESTNVGSDFRAPQPTKSRQQPVARPASQPTKSQAPVQKAPQPIARPAPQPTKTRQQPRPAPQPTKTQAPVQRAPQPVARPAPQPIKTRQQPRPAPQPTKTQAPQPIARPAPQPTKTQRPQQVARTVPAPPAPRAQRPQPVARPAPQPSKTRQQPIARPAPQPTKTQRPQQAARPVAIPQAPRAQRPQPIPRPAPKPVQTSQESTVDDEDNDVSFGSASEDQTVQQADSNSQYMVVPLSGLNHPEINNIIANRGPIVAANRDSGLWLNENQLRNLLAISNYRS